MDAYTRYPNRAKPTAEPPRPNYKLDDSSAESSGEKPEAPESQEPGGEETDEVEFHYSGYKVIEPEPEPEQQSLTGILTDAEPQLSARAKKDMKKKKAAVKPPAPLPPAPKPPVIEPPAPQPPVVEPPVPRPSIPEPPIRELPISEPPNSEPPITEPTSPEPQTKPAPKLARKQLTIYVAAVAGVGVLLGLVIAYWFMGNGGQYDLGAYTSSAAGLKGHLSTKWEKKAMYRLTIEPSDKSRQEGFALAVASSQIPLSIEIHLQDSHGAVLCSKEIILKYNAANAATPAASTADSDAGNTDAGNTSNDQAAQAIDRARYEAEEPERELDKDSFQNQIGKDGQIVSMRAEGEMPCSKRAYGDTFAWSFTSNFPAIEMQDELQKLKDEAQANESRLAAAELAARKAKAPKSAIRLVPFSMEGDDSIVEFDATRGVIETRGGKTFYFDKTGGQGADPKWQDYPVSIHYRCDRAASCILTQARLGALRARTNR
jgi:hypothetical protein